MIDKARAFLHWIGHPLRAVAAAFGVLVNLSRQQMRSLFSVAMIGGVIALSTQNVLYTYLARRAVDEGDTYRPLFLLIQEQMRFNSGLIAWFALILGLVVFGADYFRARLGEKEIEFGEGAPTPKAADAGGVI